MADKGFTSLGFMELGPRQVTNSVRPIKTMADLKGLKIRLQPNETHLATFRALGANPLAMDIKEVYSAMEQKVIDGHENPVRADPDQPLLRGAEVRLQHGALLRLHRRGREQARSSRRCRLNTARSMQDGDGEAAVAAQRSAAAKADAEALAELQKKGMVYDRDAARAEREAMRKATAGVVDDIKKRVGADLVDQVLAEVKKAGG